MSDELATKRCTKCGLVRPVSQFYKRKKGLQPWCKFCVRDYQRDRYRRLNPDSRPRQSARQLGNAVLIPEPKDNAEARRVFVCPSCNLPKPIKDFQVEGEGYYRDKCVYCVSASS